MKENIAKKNVLLLSLIQFFNQINFYSVIIILYFTDITGSYMLGMSIFSITTISTAILEIPTGILSDKIGRKKTIVIGSICSIVSNTILLLAKNYNLLIIYALFSGLEKALFSGNNDAYVYDNLKKFIAWTLPTNMGEGLIVIVAIILNLSADKMPISAVQLLWINTLTSVMLGTGFAFEEKEDGIMERQPRKSNEPIFKFPLIFKTAFMGVLMAVAGLFCFNITSSENVSVAQTVVVNSIIFMEIFYIFICRNINGMFFSRRFYKNITIWLGILLMIVIQMFFTYSPFMNKVFGSAPLSLYNWGVLLSVALFVFFIMQYDKLLFIFNRGKRG